MMMMIYDIYALVWELGARVFIESESESESESACFFYNFLIRPSSIYSILYHTTVIIDYRLPITESYHTVCTTIYHLPYVRYTVKDEESIKKVKKQNKVYML